LTTLWWTATSNNTATRAGWVGGERLRPGQRRRRTVL